MLAVIRLRPKPPARVEIRNINLSVPGEVKSALSGKDSLILLERKPSLLSWKNMPTWTNPVVDAKAVKTHDWSTNNLKEPIIL